MTPEQKRELGEARIPKRKVTEKEAYEQADRMRAAQGKAGLAPLLRGYKELFDYLNSQEIISEPGTVAKMGEIIRENLESVENPVSIPMDFSYKGSDRDWPEDFPHENGSYFNQCFVCKETFLGYKRRAICKKCYLMSVI